MPKAISGHSMTVLTMMRLLHQRHSPFAGEGMPEGLSLTGLRGSVMLLVCPALPAKITGGTAAPSCLFFSRQRHAPLRLADPTSAKSLPFDPGGCTPALTGPPAQAVAPAYETEAQSRPSRRLDCGESQAGTS